MLQRLVDPAAVEAEIERVRSLSGDALRRRWRAVFGRPVPQHLTADLLRRMIAAQARPTCLTARWGTPRLMPAPDKRNAIRHEEPVEGQAGKARHSP
jgi:hypothetical protein